MEDYFCGVNMQGLLKERAQELEDNGGGCHSNLGER